MRAVRRFEVSVQRSKFSGFALPMNLSSVSVGATRRPRFQKVDWVERATGPFCRATRPTAERVRRYGIAERFARKTRRQVAAEDGQVGRATRNKGTHFGKFMGSNRELQFGEFSPLIPLPRGEGNK